MNNTNKTNPSKTKKVKSTKVARRRARGKFMLNSKQGKAIEAKLKDVVTTEIMQHRRVAREQLHDFLAKLVSEDKQQPYTRTEVAEPKEGASMTFIPRESVKKPDDVLKLPPAEAEKEVPPVPSETDSDDYEDDVSQYEETSTTALSSTTTTKVSNESPTSSSTPPKTSEDVTMVKVAPPPPPPPTTVTPVPECSNVTTDQVDRLKRIIADIVQTIHHIDHIRKSRGGAAGSQPKCPDTCAKMNQSNQ